MTEVEYLLVVAMEECNEVSQRISKALRFGLGEIQPGQELTNAERIGEELLDLFAVLKLLEEHGTLNGEQVKSTIYVGALSKRKEKIKKFMEYSRQCGTLTS